MGKHLSKNQWFELISNYNNNFNKEKIIEKYKIFTNNFKLSPSGIHTFMTILKYKSKLYNKGMSYVLEHRKDPLILKKRGRPPKNRKRNNNEINWENFTKEELIEIAKRYVQIIDEKDKTQEAKSLKSIRVTRISELLNISRQTIYNLKKDINNQNKNKSNICEKYKKEIFEVRNKYPKQGRMKLAKLLLKYYKIDLNDRTLGRFLSKLKLNATIRKSKKSRELKDTKFNGQNLMQRDFNDTQNRNFKSTDITYIPATKDAKGNHVFLSAIIDNKTKVIESFALSFYNDLDLVFKNIQKTNFK
ncbi:hypothetical protein, partial [Mycoplasmopsis gallinarum]|uniref:hypothetical protein n=1 Tax=Mycoplasmopsis gallinarum TaxID=29557 RepID=UPI0007C5BCD4